MPRDKHSKDEDLLDRNFPEGEEARARGMRILSMFAVGVAVIFIAVVGYIYVSGNRPVDPNNLPLITENNPPEKTKPADPGGMEIPHQDASVYDHLDPKQAADQPEKLLPASEAPVAPAAQADQQTSRPADQDKVASTPATVPEQLPGLPSGADHPASQQAATPDKADQMAATNPSAQNPNPPVPSSQSSSPPVNQSTGYRIQLGAVRDEAAAQKEWSRMETKYGDQLKGLNSSFTPVSLGDKGTFLRIQAGPLSKEEAEARCAKLKVANQACLIVKAAQ